MDILFKKLGSLVDALTKALLNSLSCPICNGLVDLLGYGSGYQERHYNFCCVNNWEHYRLFLNHWDDNFVSMVGGPPIEYETVIVYDPNKPVCYSITQFDYGKTEVWSYAVDGDGQAIRDPGSKRSVFDKKLFDFAKIGGKEILLGKIRMALIFQ